MAAARRRTLVLGARRSPSRPVPRAKAAEPGPHWAPAEAAPPRRNRPRTSPDAVRQSKPPTAPPPPAGGDRSREFPSPQTPALRAPPSSPLPPPPHPLAGRTRTRVNPPPHPPPLLHPPHAIRPLLEMLPSIDDGRRVLLRVRGINGEGAAAVAG